MSENKNLMNRTILVLVHMLLTFLFIGKRNPNEEQSFGESIPIKCDKACKLSYIVGHFAEVFNLVIWRIQ